jgi:hypothetical protein
MKDDNEKQKNSIKRAKAQCVVLYNQLFNNINVSPSLINSTQQTQPRVPLINIDNNSNIINNKSHKINK